MHRSKRSRPTAAMGQSLPSYAVRDMSVPHPIADMRADIAGRQKSEHAALARNLSGSASRVDRHGITLLRRCTAGRRTEDQRGLPR